MRSTSELVNELRNAPHQWIDTAIVVVLEDGFEFVSEANPFPITRLQFLEKQGGLAIGVAGMKSAKDSPGAFCAKVFKEYEGQTWAHRYMEQLRRIVRRNSENL